MEDDELQAIRARRLAELQGKSGGSSQVSATQDECHLAAVLKKFFA